jgi:hypothetical protein
MTDFLILLGVVALRSLPSITVSRPFEKKRGAQSK